MNFLRGCLALFLLMGLSGTAGAAVPVRMQGRAYDAYTGASGMPWAEYLSRLETHSAITEKVVETVARVP